MSKVVKLIEPDYESDDEQVIKPAIQPVLKQPKLERKHAATKGLLDLSTLDTSQPVQYFRIQKHELTESVDLSHLESKWSKSQLRSSFGGIQYKKVYDLSKLEGEIPSVSMAVYEELSRALPKYDIATFERKAEIWNKDLSEIKYLTLNVAVKHATKEITINYILA